MIRDHPNSDLWLLTEFMLVPGLFPGRTRPAIRAKIGELVRDSDNDVGDGEPHDLMQAPM